MHQKMWQKTNWRNPYLSLKKFSLSSPSSQASMLDLAERPMSYRFTITSLSSMARRKSSASSSALIFCFFLLLFVKSMPLVDLVMTVSSASACPAQGSPLGQMTAASSAKHGLHLPAVRTLMLVSPPIGEPAVVILI